MKKLKLHKFEIKQKKEAKGRVGVGANTELWMDGKKMKGVTKVTLVCEARSVNKIRIELVGEFASNTIGYYEPVQAGKEEG